MGIRLEPAPREAAVRDSVLTGRAPDGAPASHGKSAVPTPVDAPLSLRQRRLLIDVDLNAPLPAPGVPRPPAVAGGKDSPDGPKIFAARESRWIEELPPGAELGSDRDVHLFPEHVEGGALVHLDGLYYAIGSHLTDWPANPNLYATAQSLEGPWSEFKDIAPPESKTYGSQSTMLAAPPSTQPANP
jgi:hypothetical protein